MWFSKKEKTVPKVDPDPPHYERHLRVVDITTDCATFSIESRHGYTEGIQVTLFPGDSLEWGVLRNFGSPFHHRDGLTVDYIGRTSYGYLRASVSRENHTWAPRCTCDETTQHPGKSCFWVIDPAADCEITHVVRSLFSRQAKYCLNLQGFSFDAEVDGSGSQHPFAGFAERVGGVTRHWYRENGYAWWPEEDCCQSMSSHAEIHYKIGTFPLPGR